MSRRVALVLGLLLVFSVFSIVNAAETVKDPETFTYVTIGDQNTLDPHFSYDTGSSEVIYQVYENLVDYQGESITEFIPRLASKVPTKENGLISADGKHYTFPIRQGVKFSNGNALTPEDVKYSFLRGMISDRAGGPIWMLYEPLLGIGSLDQLTEKVVGVKDPKQLTPEQSAKVFTELDKTVEIKGNNVIFHLANPYPPFMSIIAQGASWGSILDKEWTIEQGDWDGKPTTIAKYHDPAKEEDPLYDMMMGTGPYILTEWVNGDHVIFRRNDNYWGKPANFKTVIIKNVDEFSTRKLMLKRGDADMVYVDDQYLPQVRAMEGVQTVEGYPRLSATNMLLNWTINTKGNDYIGSGKLDGNGIPGNFFADEHVRRGFSYAFNYKAFIEQVRMGNATKMRGPVINPLIGFDENSPVYQLDLNKAAEEFKKAFGGELWEKGFKMTIAYNAGNDVRKIAADIFKTYIEQINPKFDIDVRGVQWSNFLDLALQGKLPVNISGWAADFPDSHNFVQPFMHPNGYHGSQRGANYEKWAVENGVVDLIDQGIKELDANKRLEIYKELQSMAHEHAIDVWLDQPVGHVVMREWVTGFYPNAMKPFRDFYILDK